MTGKKEQSALEEQITENLRRAYNERAEQDVPDRFRDLLQLLKDQDHAQGASDADG